MCITTFACGFFCALFSLMWARLNVFGQFRFHKHPKSVPNHVKGGSWVCIALAMSLWLAATCHLFKNNENTVVCHQTIHLTIFHSNAPVHMALIKFHIKCSKITRVH